MGKILVREEARSRGRTAGRRLADVMKAEVEGSRRKEKDVVV